MEPPLLPPAPPALRPPPTLSLSAAAPSLARAPSRRHSRLLRSAAAAAATAASPAPLLLRRLRDNAGSHGAHLPNRPGGKPLPTRTGPPPFFRRRGGRREYSAGTDAVAGEARCGKAGKVLSSRPSRSLVLPPRLRVQLSNYVPLSINSRYWASRKRQPDRRQHAASGRQQ